MSKLYIITGPAGVGKSTISRKLAELKDKSALIEGDEIYHQVVGGYVSPWKDGNHLEVFWKVCIDTVKEVVQLSNLSKDALPEIETKITQFMMEAKKEYTQD